MDGVGRRGLFRSSLLGSGAGKGGDGVEHSTRLHREGLCSPVGDFGDGEGMLKLVASGFLDPWALMNEALGDGERLVGGIRLTYRYRKTG